MCEQNGKKELTNANLYKKVCIIYTQHYVDFQCEIFYIYILSKGKSMLQRLCFVISTSILYIYTAWVNLLFIYSNGQLFFFF